MFIKYSCNTLYCCFVFNNKKIISPVHNTLFIFFHFCKISDAVSTCMHGYKFDSGQVLYSEHIFEMNCNNLQ